MPTRAQTKLMGKPSEETAEAASPARRRSSRVASRSSPGAKQEVKVEVKQEVKVEVKQEVKVEIKQEKEEEEEEAAESEDGEEDEVAAYERKRLANIQRNLQFMQSLGVSTAKIAARTAVATVVSAPVKRKQREKPVIPQRKSRRLEGKDSELVQLGDKTDDARGRVVVEVQHEPHRLDPHLAASALNTSEEYNKKFLAGIVGDDEELEEREEDLRVDATGVAVLSYGLRDQDVIKALPERVYSMTFLPRTDQMVVAAGDKVGNLALWSVPRLAEAKSSVLESEDTVVVYRPHTGAVTQMHVSPQDSTKLLSSSFDGSVREFDLRGGAFTEVFATEDYTGITSLALAGGDAAGVYFASGEDGHVWQIDRRQAAASTKGFMLHEKKINTVHCHPTTPYSIATASLDRTVCLWDVRKLRTASNKPIATMPHHRSVNCAYFSPTGAHLVTVGQDNYVNVFDTVDTKYEDPENVEPSLAIPHNNITGRWLTKLHASWDPKRPNQFVIGCMQQPRRVQIFQATRKNPIQELKSDLFNSVHSINVFHPTLGAIAGGNSSGRLCVWRAKHNKR